MPERKEIKIPNEVFTAMLVQMLEEAQRLTADYPGVAGSLLMAGSASLAIDRDTFVEAAGMIFDAVRASQEQFFH